jgi:hypothetical protein
MADASFGAKYAAFARQHAHLLRTVESVVQVRARARRRRCAQQQPVLTH